MDAVRSLLLVPADTASAALDLPDAPDATLVDLMHTDRAGDEAATATIDALIGAGHRVYLHTRGPQSPDLRDQLLATLRPPVRSPDAGDKARDETGVYGISLPGVVHADQLRFVESLLEDVERRHGIEPGLTAIGLWIESAAALARAEELASASSRLTWLGVGTTQLAMELGLDAPVAPLLDHARARTVFAAQASGLPAVEGSLAGPSLSLDAERAHAAERRQLGLRGALTRRPAAVAVFNDTFPVGGGG